jgi:hypothetical protein
VKVTLSITDQASPALKNLLASAKAPALLRVGGRGVANRLRSHYDHLHQTRPNKLGGKRVNFWLGVKRSVQNPVLSGNAAVVAINHVGIRQRLQGGIIRPGRGTNRRTGRPIRLLAIPIHPDAYGRRPAERDDLDFIPGKRGGGVLVQSRMTNIRLGRRRKDGSRKITPESTTTGIALYALVRQVVQRPDPTVLPPQQDMAKAAVDAMNQWLSVARARGTVPSTAST